MFGFLKKLGKKSEPAAAVATVAAPAVASSRAYAAPAPTAPPPAPARPARTVTPAPVGDPVTSPYVARPAMAPAPAYSPASSAGESFAPSGMSTWGHTPVATAPPPAPVVAPTQVPSATPPPAVMVELSLRKLWTKLNPEVVRTASGHPQDDAMLRLPLALIQAQLAKGAVKMPLAQFRQYSPNGLFPKNPEKDMMEVEIPISEVIPLLKPEHLSRRPNQRKINVPDDIGPIFGPSGGSAYGLRISEQKPRSGPGTSAPAPAAMPVSPAPIHAPTPVPQKPATNGFHPTPMPAAASAPQMPAAFPVPPKTTVPRKQAMPDLSGIPDLIMPMAPVAAAAAVAPQPQAQAPVAIAPISPISPISPIAEQAEFTAPISPIAQSAPIAPTPSLESEPIRAPKLDPSLATLRPAAAPAPAPAPVPSQTPPTATPAPAEGTFTLALMDVAAYWTEKGKNELANLYRHTLDIPMSTLEKTLKGGKLQFQWREVRPWLRLAPGNTLPTLADDLVVELPLAIVAPRFMEQRGLGKPKVREDLTGDIPEVFEQKHSVNGSTGTMTAPPLGATSVPLENAEALTAPGKSGDTAFLTRTGGKPLLEFGEIFGQPEKKNWTMAEVAQKAMALRGVSGAIIATNDGLLVAGAWPNGVKGDAVAAFVPQMYSKIVQYGKELNIGEPGNFTLTIENVPLQIFKAGNSYFTVIGRAGETLPKAQLNAVAMRLATMTK